MANRYVRAGATGGANNGTDWDNAWTSWPASNLYNRGDIIYVGPGTYSAPGQVIKTESGTQFITVRRATIADHGTETGWVGSYAIDSVSPAGTPSVINGGWFLDNGYWEFDGKVGGGPGSWRSGHGFEFLGTADSNVVNMRGDNQGSGNLILRHIKLKTLAGDTFNTDCIKVVKPVFTVQYCWIDRPGICCMKISDNVTDGLVEYSVLDSCDNTTGAGSHAEIMAIFPGCKRIDIRFNLVTDPRSTGGIILWGRGPSQSTSLNNEDISFYRNVCYQAVGGFGLTANHGIFGFQGDNEQNVQGHGFVNIHCVNNIFYGFNYGGAGRVMQQGQTRTNCTCKNNIFMNISVTADAVLQNSSGFTHDYNAFRNVSGVGGDGKYGEANGLALGADPFVDAANQDFHLTSDVGPAEDLGSVYDEDYEGNIEDALWNMGALIFDGEVLPVANRKHARIR